MDDLPHDVDLLTFPLQDASCAEQLRRVEVAHGQLAATDPERYVAAFIDEMVATFPLLRAFFLAAVQLGADGFWEAMDDAIGGELEERLASLVQARGAGFDPVLRTRSPKRTYLSAVLDRSITPAELRRDLTTVLTARR